MESDQASGRGAGPGEEGSDWMPRRLGRRVGEREGERDGDRDGGLRSADAFSLPPSWREARSGRRSRSAVPGVSASRGSAPPCEGHDVKKKPEECRWCHACDERDAGQLVHIMI